MVKAKRQLRSAQRINHAEKIMQSSQNDTKLFHQLIKRQRRNNHSIDKMIFKGDEYDDTEGIHTRMMVVIFYRLVWKQ